MERVIGSCHFCGSLERVIGSCHFCGSIVWAYNIKELLNEAQRLNFRVEIHENKIYTECKKHRTDIIKKYSFIFNDERICKGGTNLSTSGWYGRFTLVWGNFAIKDTPLLIKKIEAWDYGKNGGFQAIRDATITKEEFEQIKNNLPKNQTIFWEDRKI